MAIIIEAVYEQGVLKPLEDQSLKEHHRYRLIMEEIQASTVPDDPALGSVKE